MLGLALGGVLLGHTAAYRLLIPDAHTRTLELAASGHGYLSGANVVGALRLAERLPQGSVVVTLAVDSGFKYMTGPPFGA